MEQPKSETVIKEEAEVQNEDDDDAQVSPKEEQSELKKASEVNDKAEEQSANTSPEEREVV